MIQFTVVGQARPAGSKVSGVAYRKDASGKSVPVTKDDGRIVTFTKDSSGDKGAAWRADVREACARVLPEGFAPLTGPLRVTLAFYVERGKGHYRSGRNAHLLRDSAPAYPTTRPDVLKLARAIEDALTKIAYVDDSQIVLETISKEFGTPARCEVSICDMWPVAHEGTLPLDLAEPEVTALHSGGHVPEQVHEGDEAA